MLTDSLRIKIEVKNINVRNKLEEIIRTTEGVQVQRSDDTRRSNLLIFELADDTGNEFQHVQFLLNTDAVDEVFLTSEKPDQAVLMQAIRTGVQEFLSQPLKKEEVEQALERFKKRQEKSQKKEPVKFGQTLNVIGSKGGVGTTTVAVNLAVSLAEKKDVESVALVDMNMLFGEIPLFLEVKPRHHLGELVKHITRLDTTFLMNSLSKSSAGVYVLPSANHLDGYEPVNPKVMDRVINLMKTMFDFVVIDGGQTLDRQVSLKILEMSDIALLVSVLSLPCLSNTDKLLKSFSNLGYPVEKLIRVVINRYLKNAEISLKDAEAAINKKIFWTIPNDFKTTLSAINQGKPLSQIAKRAPITKNLKELADIIIEGKNHQGKKWWSSVNG